MDNSYGTLYIVATPIGNLGDFSQRAIDILSSVDLIASEDTETSRVLTDHFGISARLIPYHKFNEKASVDGLIDFLINGKTLALISDAGTPCINDPGFILVSEAVRRGINVIPIPGACAAVSALSVSGFELKNFAYEGFFPRETKDAKIILAKLNDPLYPNVAVFYESPRRIVKTMQLICEALPEAKIALANDLTKKFERIYRGSAGEVLAELNANPAAEKGEYTLVVERSVIREIKKDAPSPEALLVDTMVKRGVTLRDAVKIAAGESGVAKSEVYDASLRLKRLLQQSSVSADDI